MPDSLKNVNGISPETGKFPALKNVFCLHINMYSNKNSCLWLKVKTFCVCFLRRQGHNRKAFYEERGFPDSRSRRSELLKFNENILGSGGGEGLFPAFPLRKLP